MFNQDGYKSTGVLFSVLAVLPLFAGCGGDDGEDEVTETQIVNNSSGHSTCLSWTEYYEDPAACLGTAPSNNSGSSSPPPGGTGSTNPPTSGSGVAALINDETEPNDSRDNANPMDYPTRAGSITHIGWVAAGSVHETADTVDYFVFTAPMSRDYTVRLCPPNGSPCHGTGGLDTLTAFFELLDQDGNVLLSSRGSASNAYEVAIDAGVVYYARVIASDTMGVSVDYRLQAFESK